MTQWQINYDCFFQQFFNNDFHNFKISPHSRIPQFFLLTCKSNDTEIPYWYSRKWKEKFISYAWVQQVKKKIVQCVVQQITFCGFKIRTLIQHCRRKLFFHKIYGKITKNNLLDLMFSGWITNISIIFTYFSENLMDFSK